MPTAQQSNTRTVRKLAKPLAMRVSQVEYIKQVSKHTPKAARVLNRCFSRVSRLAAVKAKCWECTNWQRSEVTRCHIDTCPLWPYRPFASGARAAKANAETEPAEPVKNEA